MERFDCEAILFDLDGVLVDSTRSVERVWRTWAEGHGLDTARVVEVAHGRRAVETVRLFAPHLDAEVEAKKLEQAEIEDTAGLRKVDGAAASLATLTSDSWAVVTSGTRSLASSRLRTHRPTDPAGPHRRRRCRERETRSGVLPDRCTATWGAGRAVRGCRGYTDWHTGRPVGWHDGCSGRNNTSSFGAIGR